MQQASWQVGTNVQSGAPRQVLSIPFVVVSVAASESVAWMMLIHQRHRPAGRVAAAWRK